MGDDAALQLGGVRLELNEEKLFQTMDKKLYLTPMAEALVIVMEQCILSNENQKGTASVESAEAIEGSW